MTVSFKMRFLVKNFSRITITQNLFNLSNHSLEEWARITKLETFISIYTYFENKNVL